ncbi:MAG: PAS domain S-box protein, partial [Vicinamibacteria bacterium]|nr:PAS domain S-box protein [Vicinamibacteria bacterium]
MRDELVALRQVETALRESEERYRRITVAVTDYIYSVKIENGRAVETHHGPGCVSVTGFSSEEFAEDPYLWYRMLPAEDCGRVEEQAERLTRGEDCPPIEHRIVRKDGELRWVRNTPVLHNDPDGRLQSYDGLIRDITERKQAEMALRESQQNLTRILETSPVGIVIVDVGGQITFANSTAEMILGLTRDDLKTQTYNSPDWQITRIDSQPFQEDDLPFHRVIREGIAVFGIEHAIVHPNGRRVFLSINASPLRDEAGQLKGMLAALTDITERKQAEARLRLTQISIDGASDAVFWFDRDGRYRYVNEAACRHLGYSQEELLALSVWDVAQDLKTSGWKERWAQIEAQGTVSFESQYRAKDGHIVPIALTINLVRFEGEVYGFAYARDISERLRAEEERRLLEERLAQTQKMEAIGRLAGGVAHDFNNLLTGILGFDELLSNKLGPTHILQHEVREIRDAAERATTLTRQLLAFSRKQVLTPKLIDLNLTLAPVQKMLSRLIGEDVDIAFLPGSELWRIRADPTQIDQILINLATNARDAMPSGGSVTIETANVVCPVPDASGAHGEQTGEYVILSVHDTGHGMDAATRARVFEPFFSTKEGCTGLGLPMVYGIAHQHGGFAEVDSEPGCGTTVRIYFPRASGEAAAATASGPMVGGHETILLVEDDIAVRKLTHEALAQLGYHILSAENAEVALHLSAAHAGVIHLLLTDVIMPHMNGRDLATEIVKARPQT